MNKNIFALCLLLLSTACSQHDDPTPTPEPSEGERTVILYISGQNSLDAKGYLKKDSAEVMAGVSSLSENSRLLVYVDDAAAPRIYRYYKNCSKPELVRKWDTDQDSSDPATLLEVLTWVKSHYPSKEYGLVMWSHSDGWVPPTFKSTSSLGRKPLSFGIDTGENSLSADAKGTQMTIKGMRDALNRSGLHFKYIFFDSCNMQCLETCYLLRKNADYIIGSPAQIPGVGANYTTQLQNGLFSNDPTDIARTYYTDATSGRSEYKTGLVISVVKTSEMENVAAATASVLPSSSLVGRQSPDLSNVLRYGECSARFFYRPEYFDARQVMQAILPAAQAAAFNEALDQAIVYKATTETFYVGASDNAYYTSDASNFAGVSLFMPQAIYTSNAPLATFGDLNSAFQAEEWYTATGWNVTGW